MRSGPCAARNSRASLRAVGRLDAATESSRSRINASAPDSRPCASFRSLSAGTNSIERIGSSYPNVIPGSPERRGPESMNTGLWNMDSGFGPSGRPGMTSRQSRRLCLHQGGAAADRDLLAALVQGDMLQFDDAGIGARLTAP